VQVCLQCSVYAREDAANQEIYSCAEQRRLWPSPPEESALHMLQLLLVAAAADSPASGCSENGMRLPAAGHTSVRVHTLQPLDGDTLAALGALLGGLDSLQYAVVAEHVPMQQQHTHSTSKHLSMLHLQGIC